MFNIFRISFIITIFIFKTLSFNQNLFKTTFNARTIQRSLHLALTGNAPSNKYLSVPQNLEIKKVLVFIRHGDRSQIAKELGSRYPEDLNVTAYWKSKMPNSDDINKLLSVATSKHDKHAITKEATMTPFERLYIGRDTASYPYGMLTAVGARQLAELGQRLRNRYNRVPSLAALFANDNTHKQPHIYCRSTRICRTMMSLHALLYGLLIGSLDEVPTNTIAYDSLPWIVTRPKLNETLYPQADGPCIPISNRRDVLFKNNFLSRSFHKYIEFEEHMKGVFGYVDTVNWLVLKDVLTCHMHHEIPLPKGTPHTYI